MSSRGHAREDNAMTNHIDITHAAEHVALIVTDQADRVALEAEAKRYGMTPTQLSAYRADLALDAKTKDVA